MYKIKVKAKKRWHKARRKAAKQALAWGIKELELDVSPIPIVVKLCGDPQPEFRWGDSIDCDHKIMIRLFDTPLWIPTLFHELEHARQFIYGELELETDFAIWKGKTYKRSGDEYYEEPWEVQAREIEDQMETKFLTFVAPTLIM